MELSTLRTTPTAAVGPAAAPRPLLRRLQLMNGRPLSRAHERLAACVICDGCRHAMQRSCRVDVRPRTLSSERLPSELNRKQSDLMKRTSQPAGFICRKCRSNVTVRRGAWHKTERAGRELYTQGVRRVSITCIHTRGNDLERGLLEKLPDPPTSTPSNDHGDPGHRGAAHALYGRIHMELLSSVPSLHPRALAI
jgi:hypothetical protein